MTEVVHVRTDEWRDAAENGRAVYIGRKFAEFPASDWGNPFVIGPDGDRRDVLRKYREWLLDNNGLVMRLPTLDGMVLGCWCSPMYCHGDIIVEALEALKRERA